MITPLPLPVPTRTSCWPRKPPLIRDKSLERSCILIVDDELQIRRFLRISLVSQGHEVIGVANGGEGLVCVIGDRPDLDLPDIDGLR